MIFDKQTTNIFGVPNSSEEQNNVQVQKVEQDEDGKNIQIAIRNKRDDLQNSARKKTRNDILNGLRMHFIDPKNIQKPNNNNINNNDNINNQNGNTINNNNNNNNNNSGFPEQVQAFFNEHNLNLDYKDRDYVMSDLKRFARSIQLYCSLFRCPNPDFHVYGLKGFSSYCSITDNEARNIIIQKFLDYNMMDHLIKRLKNIVDNNQLVQQSDIVGQGFQILSYMNSTEDNNLHLKFNRSYGIDMTIYYIKQYDNLSPEIQINLLFLIGNLCGNKDATFRNIYKNTVKLDQKILQILSNITNQFKNNIEIPYNLDNASEQDQNIYDQIQNMLWILSNFMSDINFNFTNLEYFERCVQILETFLNFRNSQSLEILEHVVDNIYNFINEISRNLIQENSKEFKAIERIRELGYYPTLLKYLKCSYCDLKSNQFNSKFLRSILSTYDEILRKCPIENQEGLEDYQIILTIKEVLLNGKKYKQLKLTSLELLTALIHKNKEPILKTCIDIQLLEDLFENATNEDKRVKEQLLRIIKVSINVGDIDINKQLVNKYRIFKFLFEQLELGTAANLIIKSLQIILDLAQEKEFVKFMVTNTLDCNTDKIEALQSHQREDIYNKSVEIVEIIGQYNDENEQEIQF